MNKALSGKKTLEKINPTIEIAALTERMDEARLPQLVKTADIVLDCTDNFRTRLSINRICMSLGKPLVSGAVVAFDGRYRYTTPAEAILPLCLRSRRSAL